ncbi:MAG: flagellar hook-length control protein FliK [Sulfurimonas sp.]|nr:flagellar hook-length control protein FliK [Sulfurimonas sp.]
MISLDVKPESNLSSPINLSVSEDKPEVSFSDLLRGVKNPKDKEIQNGLLVLSLDSKEEVVVTKDIKKSSKKDTLLSLLKHDDKFQVKTKDTLELNPTITQTLSPKEIKTLVVDAKEFLKNRIINSDEYKRAEVKDLPKTLKGLAEMAKKFGVDVSKITIQEVSVSKNPIEVKDVLQKEVLKTEIKDVLQKKVSKTEDKGAPQKEILKSEVKIPHAKVVQEIKTKEVFQELKVNENIREDVKVDNKRAEITQDFKSTPLFKAQDKTEHSTEQLVQSKQFKVEEKTPREKADETLKLLLRGEKPSLNSSINLTADFSVATAKVIAPNATTEVTKSLEQLLHGEKDNSTQNSKIDGLTTSKADSFEVKLNEAKQMIKYISQDVKNAIENYKSPFIRIKVQLNPQKLGEIDLTVVQRGKNLHINISSNNTAINTLSMNANELRTQLANTGINNATLNFNNSSQNSEQNGSQQQQNSQNEQKADEEYNYFDNEEQNEEILNSLEIVVPSYA